ncbi:hypothetical protein Godav_019745, partial [Gossypium davidsonii]|nr:hypothetical protein [Gossypium davidsonii]
SDVWVLFGRVFSDNECCPFFDNDEYNGKSVASFKGCSDIECWGMRYLFKFFHKMDIDRVINGNPWTFNKHLLLIHQLENDEDPMFLDYDLKQLNRGLMNHLKFQVELDVRKPLKRRKKILRKEGDDDSREANLSMHGLGSNLRDEWKNDTVKNVEGKKRPKIDVSVPNVSEFSDSLGILAKQHNAHLHQISTIANGQADREP